MSEQWYRPDTDYEKDVIYFSVSHVESNGITFL